MKRLRYNKPEEFYLKYNNQPEIYLKEATTNCLPLNNIVLLKQMTGWAQFIEALMIRIPICFSLENLMKEETVFDRIDLGIVLNIAWRWHTDIIMRKQALTSHYAYAYLMSWSCFCQTFFLTVHEDMERSHELQMWPAQKYQFYQEMSRLYNIEISDDPISKYNVTDLWDSMKFVIIHGAYTIPYSIDMKRYIHALFYRYCSFLTIEEDNLELVMDNPLFIQEPDDNIIKKNGNEDEAYDAYKFITIPVKKDQHLTSSYIFEGELLFYHQFYRITLSDILFTFYENDPIILESIPTEENDQHHKLVWYQFMSAICEHSRLQQYIVNDFKKDMLYLYLYHGEKERFIRTWPEANADPNDILNQTRASDQMMALEIQKMIPLSIVTAYKEKGLYEKEVVFITFCAIKRWFAYKVYKKYRELDTLLIMEEFYSINEINLMILREKSKDKPMILRLASTCYVINGSQVYKTILFIDALFLWINLMSKIDVEFETVIHKLLRPVISHFNVI